jgi:putative tryptophan/tyrosine transport system substrate-binding protein
MRRREFIALLGSTATAWPLVAPAQQPAMPAVGLLHGASQETFAANIAAFKQGLSQTGYIDGQKHDRTSMGKWSIRSIACIGR